MTLLIWTGAASDMIARMAAASSSGDFWGTWATTAMMPPISPTTPVSRPLAR